MYTVCVTVSHVTSYTCIWVWSYVASREHEESCDVTWAWRVMWHHRAWRVVMLHEHEESCDVTWAWRVMWRYWAWSVMWRYMSMKGVIHVAYASDAWLTTLWQASNTCKVFPSIPSLFLLLVAGHLLGYWTCSAHCCKQLHFWEKF